MSLEDVAGSVIEKGQREADRIVKEGGKEVLALLSKADDEVGQTLKEYLARAKKNAKELKAREISGMEMDARRKRLNAEREVFDKIRKKAFNDLLAAPRPQKDAILSHLITKAKHIISTGYIYSNARDAEPVKRLAGAFRFGGTIDCKGGIVLENSDRSERVDMTYETIFEEVWEQQLAQVHKLIFDKQVKL